METCGSPSITKYHSGCLCIECRRVAARSQNQSRLRKLRREQGYRFNTDRVPWTQTHERIMHLKNDRGMTYEEIARLTGVSSFTISCIARKRTRSDHITRRVADSIYHLYVEDWQRDLRPGTYVHAKKTVQVINSLGAQGWTRDHLADIVYNNLHIPASTLVRVHKSDSLVYRKTQDKVLWLERNIGDAIGPSKSLRTNRTRLGYFPTKHYDAVGDIIVTSLSPEQKRIRKRAREVLELAASQTAA